MDKDVNKVFEKEPICPSCGALLHRHSVIRDNLYRYQCTKKKRKKVYKVEINTAGKYYVFPHIRKKFKYKKLEDVPKKKLRKIIACLKTPFGERKGNDNYKLTDTLRLKIYNDKRVQPHLFNIVALRGNKKRKNIINFLELIIKEINEKHSCWKSVRSPRVWYNIYCSEKRFIQTLSVEDKKKLIKILESIKREYWTAMKNNLKKGVTIYKETPYKRFYNYRSINAFFSNKDVPNFEKLINDPKPQDIKRARNIK